MINEIEFYLKALKDGNKSENTIRTYKRDIVKFVEYFQIDNISGIQNLTIPDYRRFIGDLNVSPVSKNSCIRNISAMLHWLEENEFIKGCKFFNIKFGKGKFIKELKNKKIFLTMMRVLRLLTQEKTHKLSLCWLLWCGVV